MVTEFTNGLMVVFIKGIGFKIRFLVMENTLGMIKEHIKDIGLIIICTAKEYIDGLTEESMKVTI